MRNSYLVLISGPFPLFKSSLFSVITTHILAPPPKLIRTCPSEETFSEALLSVPEKQNEVSGLMIMGLFGGTVFPLIMGFASDAVGQAGAVAVMAIGVIYLFSYIPQVKH